MSAPQPRPVDERPETSAAIVRAGETIGRTLLQELATTVATTATRERLRHRVVGLLAVVGGFVVAAMAVISDKEAMVPIGIYGGCCLAPVLPLLLSWGVRNRALLNAAANDAAVDDRILAAAVRLVLRKKLGPSAALHAALAAKATKTTQHTKTQQALPAPSSSPASTSSTAS